MMKQKEEKWQRIRWRDTHIIMIGGQTTNLYALLHTFPIQYHISLFFIYTVQIYYFIFCFLEFLWCKGI